MFDLRLVGKGLLRGYLTENPDIGFDYIYLHYEPSKGMSIKILRDEQFPLDDEEIQKIEDYINSYPYRVWAINEEGLCTGDVSVTEVKGKYAHCPPPNLPGNYWYNDKNLQWDYIHGVDQNGQYIGNVPYKNCTYVANSPPNYNHEKWNNDLQQWVDTRTLEDVKILYLEELNKLSKHAILTGAAILKGHVWKTSEDEIARLQSAPLDTSSWIDFFGDTIQFDGFTKDDILKAIDEQNAWILKRKRDAIIKVSNARTKEEVNAIEW